MKFYCKKIISCRLYDIHLHYANNRGRGTNNVTVTIVTKLTARRLTTSAYAGCANTIRQYRTCGWCGVVNIPSSVIDDECGGYNRVNVISRRYYPWYHGKKSTYRSYKSYFVSGGGCRQGSADYIIGSCDSSACCGWVDGVRGAYAARTYEAVKKLPRFIPDEVSVFKLNTEN